MSEEQVHKIASRMKPGEECWVVYDIDGSIKAVWIMTPKRKEIDEGQTRR